MHILHVLLVFIASMVKFCSIFKFLRAFYKAAKQAKNAIDNNQKKALCETAQCGLQLIVYWRDTTPYIVISRYFCSCFCKFWGGG